MHFENLPLLAQLNIQADIMAKQALQILGSQVAPLLLLPLLGMPWLLTINLVPVATKP